MKIVILNGSPKGDLSVTMQYVAYIKKQYPEHTYEILPVAHEIKKIENDPAAFGDIMDKVRCADLVLWAFPLYYLLVCSQYKRFIELIFERGTSEVFAGKYAASLSTSIHFFDHTAHAYVRGISEDLGMKYLDGFSAEMYDLLEKKEQDRLKKFSFLLFSSVDTCLPVQRETAPLDLHTFSYVPVSLTVPVMQGEKKVVILTDDDGSRQNLTRINLRLQDSFSGKVPLYNLRNLDIRGGCLGCCTCGYDNTCIYHDGYRDFFQQTLTDADIIIMTGAVHDRYLSSVWKQFFDRSFFRGHTPALMGKQIGFAISGELRQIPCLKEALTAWADNGGCHVHFVTDEVSDSSELDELIGSFAEKLVMGADISYIPPPLFYAVGGHKIFRDNIYAGMRFVFQADYRYYREHGLFDFPQHDLKTRLTNLVFMTLTSIPSFRKRVFADMKPHMIEPFRKVLSLPE